MEDKSPNKLIHTISPTGDHWLILSIAREGLEEVLITSYGKTIEEALDKLKDQVTRPYPGDPLDLTIPDLKDIIVGPPMEGLI